MKLLTTEELKNEIYKMGKLINVDFSLYPGTKVTNFEGYYVYTNDIGYHYLYVEKGQEIFHYVTQDIEEIQYQVFQRITFSMANQYAIRNREKNIDFRRTLFRKQLELLGKLNPSFEKKRLEEINKVLIVNPYNDSL